MTIFNDPILSELVVRERDILARIAAGGPLDEVLRDLVLLIEQPANGEMLASVLFVSEDGKRLLEGAAPSLPKEYNDAIHGIAIGPNVGSCGTAAHHGRPVIVSDIETDPLWQGFREIAMKHGLRACWSVPVMSADGSVLGTYANYYREPKVPTERDMDVISMVARTTGIAIERHRHELARQRAEEQRQILLMEMNHRVKNVFALVGALVAMSARTESTAAELAQNVQARLSALSRAHGLVNPASTAALSEASSQGHAPSFRALLDAILDPYEDLGMLERVAICGRDFLLTRSAVTSLALVLHELTTNAVKYGCFKEPGGALSLGWDLDNDTLRFLWAESGFACTPPIKVGFGTTLTRNTVERQLAGTIHYDWRADGFHVALTLPLTSIAQGWQTPAV